MRGGHEAIAALAVRALDLALVVVDSRRRILLTNPACEEILRTKDSLMRRDGRLAGCVLDRDDALEGMLRRLGSGRATVGRIGELCTIGIALGRSRRRFLLLLMDGRRPLPCPVDHVAQLFRLTPAEARLACALASGSTLMQHARSSAVALSTVRTQLRHVLRKSSLHRQSDLVRVIAALPGLRTL